jgi:DNA processing protein
LAAGKPAVAVWDTGADVIYPKENKKLAEDILATGGAIVSQLPLGTYPAPQNFPQRNRIRSGVSVGVLAVEASENSGTRVTAGCAADQGRDVFAVPGNVTSKQSWTPNPRIKQGGQLTATWEEVWEVLGSQVRLELEAGWSVESASESKGAGAASLLPNPPLGTGEAIVLEVLRLDAAL